MISFYCRDKDQIIYRDEVADSVNRLDGIALIEWSGRSKPNKYKSYCVWWDDYKEYSYQEFRMELEEHKELIKYTKDII